MIQSQSPSSAATEHAVEEIIESHIRMLDIGCGDEFRIPDAIAHARKEKTLVHANDLIGCVASWAAADIAKHLAGLAQAVGMRAALERAQKIIERDYPSGQLAIDIRDVLAAQPPAAPVETEEWEEVTDGTTLPGDRFSYIGNSETGVGQITSHKRRVQRISADSAKARKLAEKYERILERAKVMRRDHMELRVFQSDMETIIAALRSGDQPQEVTHPADRLENERNALQNSYGGGAFKDGMITRRIAEIDKELAALAVTRPKCGGQDA